MLPLHTCAVPCLALTNRCFLLMLLGGELAVRIGLRNRVSPGTRDVVFGAAVLTALAHAGYVSH